jgi:hypothetical protein
VYGTQDPNLCHPRSRLYLLEFIGQIQSYNFVITLWVVEILGIYFHHNEMLHDCLTYDVFSAIIILSMKNKMCVGSFKDGKKKGLTRKSVGEPHLMPYSGIHWTKRCDD